MLGSALLLSSPLLGALVGIVGAQAIADAEPSCEALVETLVRERGIAPGASRTVPWIVPASCAPGAAALAAAPEGA